MSILMCKWAEPEKDDNEEEETPKQEDDSGKKKTRSSQKESPTSKKGKSPSKSPIPVKEKSPTGSKRSTPEKEPEKEKPGPIFSFIKWADNDLNTKVEDKEEEDSTTVDAEDQSQDEDANTKEDEEIVSESNEEDKKKEEKPSLFFSVKWADSTNEAEESEKEEEAPSIPAEWLNISSSILGEIEPKDKKEPEPVKEEIILPVKEEPVDKVDELNKGTILNIRWADDPGNEVPESPPRSPTPPSPRESPTLSTYTNSEEKSSRASSVDTRSDGGKPKIPRAGPKSAMMKYRSRNSSGTSDTSSSKSSTKRKLPLAGPKSATKKIKEESGTITADADHKSKRLRCPSQKLLEWTKISEKSKPKSKKTVKETKTSLGPAIKQEPLDVDSKPLANRLKRKARPSTFNQNFNTDPNSPYLYNSSRSKGPMVRLECDMDDDHEDNLDDNYVPEVNHSTDDSWSDQDDKEGSSSKRRSKRSATTNISAPSSLSKRRASARKIKTEPEVVLDEIMSLNNETGLSLGSVYSLADEEIVIDAEPETEPILQLDMSDMRYTYGGGAHHHEDPLFDPLSSTSSHSFLRKRPSFTWPKLDPLFLIMTHYQLPSSFDPLIRARVTPTAKIYPMQNLKSPGAGGFDGMDSLSISKVVSSSSSIGTRSTPGSSGIRRSGRKKVGRYEMKNLFDGSIVDTPYSLPAMSSSRRSKSNLATTPSSIPTPTTPSKTEDLAARLSKYSGSSITITPYKDSPASKSGKGSAGSSPSIQTRTVPLDRKDFPWLPRDWKVSATVDTEGVVLHSFISPSGVSLNSQSAVMQFLRSTDPKTYQAALYQQAAANRKRGKQTTLNSPATNNSARAKAAAAATKARAAAAAAKQRQLSINKKQKPGATASPKNKVVSKNTVIVSDSEPVKREPYKILCKAGDFSCPLCNTNFKLNQTYGRHVVAKKCKTLDKEVRPPPMRVPDKSTPWILEEEDVDEDTGNAKTTAAEKDDGLEVLQANVTPVPLNHVKVQNCTVKDDSYVDISSVPSLKLLSRGKKANGGLIKVPISVKEGLEYYHSIVWKENNENTYFDELVAKTKLTMCSTVGAYEELCKEPLKVALFLERKISISREKFGHRALRTKNWVQKYERFLKLPIQDVYLSLQDQTYKVIEHNCNGEVKPMCLNCSVATCPGCALVRPPAPKTTQSSPSKKIAVPIRVKSTGANRGTPLSTMARCGICTGCMQPNCRRCTFCRDMKRYGGPAKLKRACEKRICVQGQGGANSGAGGGSSGAGSGPSSLAVIKSSTFVMKSNPAGSSSVASKVVASGIRTISPSSNNSGSPASAFDSLIAAGGRTSITTHTPTATQSKSFTRIPREKSPVTIDLDDPESIQQAIQSTGRTPGPPANASNESYPCTVCKRMFPTRIQMLAHRSVAHDRTNIVASVNRPVVLHRGGNQQ